MFIENELMYNNTLLYFTPFFVISILLSIWGLNIYSQMISPYLPDEFHVGSKYISLQLVLMSLKFQAAIAYLIILGGAFTCTPPMTPNVSKNSWVLRNWFKENKNKIKLILKYLFSVLMNFIICLEMFCLALWARHLYRKPVYSASQIGSSITTSTFYV